MSTAAQKVDDVQESDSSTDPGSMLTVVHADNPPVGLLDARAWPLLSIAMQNVALVQDSAVRSTVSIAEFVHEPPRGLVDVVMLPL